MNEIAEQLKAARQELHDLPQLNCERQQAKMDMLLTLIEGLLGMADTEAVNGSRVWAKAAALTRAELAKL